LTARTVAVGERPVAVRERPAAVRAVRDAVAVTWRNLIAYRRVPQLLVFSTIQPVIFVLMFRYVFGGAIVIPGSISYVDFLIPGIFVQTVVFGAIATAIGLATDMKSGLMERFRSLPMARSAVLAGRTLADLSRNVFVVMLMLVVGFAVGFRIHTDLLGLLGGIGLLLAFGYAMSWIFATIGLVVGDPETAQAAAFPLLAPLVFASTLFVDSATMPGWLQPWADHQPVSVTANAVRYLMLGETPQGGPSDLWQSLAWIVGILVLFAPLAVRRYRRAV
jgi:ABC-2 type transport system permease protein